MSSTHYTPGQAKGRPVDGQTIPCHSTWQNYYCQIRRMLVAAIVNYDAPKEAERAK